MKDGPKGRQNSHSPPTLQSPVVSEEPGNSCQGGQLECRGWFCKAFALADVLGLASHSSVFFLCFCRFYVVNSPGQQIWETQQWPQDWKRSVFIPVPKKGNAKECSNYHTIALISHNSKVMLKILQARLQQFINRELPDVQAGFRKGRGTRDQIANIRWILKKAREFKKNIYFCFIDYAKAFDCVDYQKLENSERDGNTRPPDLPLEEFVCRSGSNS